MYAGAEVITAIERDIEAILKQDAEAREVADTAANNLDGITRTASPCRGHRRGSLVRFEGVSVTNP